MKILIIGDLHGNKPNIYYKDFDIMIASGDFCSDETRLYQFQALKERLENPKSKTTWYDITGKTKAKAMIEKSLKDGRKILEHLNSLNKYIYTVPGNWDWTSFKDSKWSILRKDNYKFLINDLTNIINTHEKIIDINNYQLIGYGISEGPEYPQYKEDLRRFKTSELKKKKQEYKKQFNKISSLFKKATKPIIFLSHNVPFNTSIDQIINPASPRDGQHFGSLITREVIDKYQPLVCIGGHMHEHFTSTHIKKTLCINAGYGSNVNTYLELENNKIKKLKFINKKPYS